MFPFPLLRIRKVHRLRAVPLTRRRQSSQKMNPVLFPPYLTVPPKRRLELKSLRKNRKPQMTPPNPDRRPEYGNDVPQSTNPPAEAPDNTSPSSPSAGENANADEHPGQVYDPVFGWIETGDTTQDNVDNDGDINKQIGTMGRQLNRITAKEDMVLRHVFSFCQKGELT